MGRMNEKVIQKLFDLNKQFYQQFGRAFAETRRRVQPGVLRVLLEWVDGGDWLDLGCGSGTLAVKWLDLKIKGRYLGLDFSRSLLEEAQQAVDHACPGGTDCVQFRFANLADEDWKSVFNNQRFTGVMAFAALHHIPGADVRLRILQQVHSLLEPGGRFIHSEWQFQHSPKLMSRIQPWSVAGLDQSEVEEGDTLLDWRHCVVGDDQKEGLRYVHLYSHEELIHLAEESGFTIEAEFESDGAGERLGLYQLWKKR